jgi:hypothetical protein
VPKRERRQDWDPVDWPPKLLMVITQFIFTEIAHVGVHVG